MQTGETHSIQIESYSHEGYGIGRIDGFVVMVPGALRGETCDIRITAVRKNYAVASLRTLHTRSPARQKPFCPYFTRCGGCDLQHMSAAETLSFKEDALQNALMRIAGLTGDLPLRPIIGMAKPFAYRNIAQFHADTAGRFGFYAKGSHHIVPIEGCPIQSDTANRLFGQVRNFCRMHRIAGVRHMVIRTTADGEAMLVLVADGMKLLDADDADQEQPFIRAIRASCPQCVSIQVSDPSAAPVGKVVGGPMRLLWGRESITDTLGGSRFVISPQSFFQVNRAQAEALYREVCAFARLTGREAVYDLYCGTGAIALLAAPEAGRVIGVESVGAAIDDAHENARLGGVTNVSFVQAQAEKYLPRALAAGERCDVVIVDPPRAGCDAKLLDAIIEAGPGRVVYVSCDPATLARDVKRLMAGGYTLCAVQPVDMFPWSRHVECVALLTKGDSGA